MLTGDAQDGIKGYTKSLSAGVLATVTLDWTIQHFSFRKHITSSLFSCTVKNSDLGLKNSTAAWGLRLVPLNKRHNNGGGDEDCMAVHIVCHNVNEEEIAAKFSVNIHNKSGVSVYQLASDLNPPRIFCRQKNEWGWPYYISHNELFVTKRLLFDDCLVLQGKVQFLTSTSTLTTGAGSLIQEKITPNISGLQRDFTELYRTRQHTDFVLISSDKKEFPVHRNILTARSQVFYAMISHDLRERSSGRCEIDDVDGETLNVLLEFVYSEESNGVRAIAEKVLVAADKYNVQELVHLAEQHLCDLLTPQNVSRMLILADQVSTTKTLKAAAIMCGVKNLPEFAGCGGLQEIYQYKSQLADEILANVGTKGNVFKQSENIDTLGIDGGQDAILQHWD